MKIALKNALRKNQSTLHDMALHIINCQIEGVISHYEMVSFGNLIPDIITEDTVHEVEAIDIRSKLSQYLTNPSAYKRVLWLALPMGTLDTFDEMNFVEIDDEHFKELPIVRKKLKQLILPSRSFKLGAPKRRKPALEILEDIEVKLRQNRFEREADVFKFVREKLWATYLT